MSITYRAEKGSPLTSAEADENIRTLYNLATQVVPRPEKNITAADLVGGVYTLQAGDEKKFLVFNVGVSFAVRVPAGVFVSGASFEGYDIGDVRVNFTYVSGIELLYGASELPRTPEKNSAFAFKFITNDKVALLGKLELI